jgi:hypothetical protein
MKYTLLIFIVSLSILGCKESTDTGLIKEDTRSTAAFVIEDRIKNKSEINGDINIMGYFVTPLFKGELKQDGSFSIVLPKDFDQLTEKAFDTYNNSDIADYELSYITAVESFPNATNLAFTGKDARLAYAGKYFRFEVIAADKSTYIYPASSETFINYVVGTKNAVPETGHHYYYIYAKEPFSIEGTSDTDNLFEDGTEEIYQRSDVYDLKITKGWNLIRYEINELATSTAGSQSISKSKVFNLDPNTTLESWFTSSL